MKGPVHRVISSEHLDLPIWNLALIEAFEADDSAGASDALGVIFPEPFRPPPETDDVLDYFREIVVEDNHEGLHPPRLIVRRVDNMVVGSIGITPPDEDGYAMIGYSVYPQFEGQGIASEAARAIVEYGLAIEGINGIYATIVPGNVASEKVAERAGMTFTGEERDDDGELLNVWWRLP